MVEFQSVSKMSNDDTASDAPVTFDEYGGEGQDPLDVVEGNMKPPDSEETEE